jgi:hypothetical protein
MRYAIRQYNFIKKDTVSIRYLSWFKGVEDGSPNGSSDVKKKGLKVSKIRAVSQRESGKRPLNIWLRKFSPLGKSWNLTRPVVLPLQESEQRLSIGNSNKERFVISQLSPLLQGFSLVMEKQIELRPKEIATVNLILILRQKIWETFIRQTLLGRDTSEAQKELPDSILFTPLMWQGIQPSQVSLPINRLSLCAGISLQHGDLWGFQRYLKWIMRWLLQAEGVTLIVFLKPSVFTCLWEFIWYSSRKENLVETPILRVLMDSGRRESSEDIIVLPLLSSEEPVNDSCSIIIMRNLIGVLLKKNMAQDSLECLKTTSGNLLDTSKRALILKNTRILTDISISLLQREGSLSSERLTSMEELRSMVLFISSGENLRDSMLLLLSLLIERDWLLNKTTGLSNLSIFQLRVILFFIFFHIQRRRLNLVHDVMIFLSIKN